MTARGLFVTGTDTGIGKTLIALGLMRLFQDCGQRVLGMKPVASGAEHGPEGLRNQDALQLSSAGQPRVPYSLINPYAFEPAVAPHLAAARAGVAIQRQRLLDCFGALAARADRVIVEGVGGWRVPLGPDFAISDLARELGLPVLLVVGLRLGCINHALMSVESIQASGCPLAGWVANCPHPAEMPERDANVATLEAAIEAPCLGLVPWMAPPRPEAVAAVLKDRFRLSDTD